MAITINGTGTITGISTGGIPDGVVDTDVLADNAVTFGKIGTTEQGQLCRAWVNFDGTLVTNPGSATGIRGSYNVSSITDNGTGDYTVNFTNALADANYSIAVTSNRANGWNATTGILATSSAVVATFNGAGSNEDSTTVSVVIFR